MDRIPFHSTNASFWLALGLLTAVIGTNGCETPAATSSSFIDPPPSSASTVSSSEQETREVRSDAQKTVPESQSADDPIPATDVPSADGPTSPPAEPTALTEAEAKVEALRERIQSVFRRLYLSVAPNARDALLRELIGDEERVLRELGFELAQRELSAGNRLSPDVAVLALDQLSSDEADTRAMAASLITRLAPEGAGEAVGAALARERDETVASAMLRAAARWPEHLSATPIIRWFRPGAATIRAATEAGWAAYEAGRLGRSSQVVMLHRLRSTPNEELPPDGMKMLVTFGEEPDQLRIVGLLTSGDAATRQAAAAAAGVSPITTPLLVEAAGTDETLYDPAVRALLRHDPSTAAVVQAATLPAPSQAVRGAALRRIASEAPVFQLVEAAESTELAPSDVETLLGPLIDPEGRVEAMTPVLVARAALRLGELRLESGAPEAALAALNAASNENESGRAKQTRAVALALLEQWGDAAAAAGDEAGIALAAARAAELAGDPSLEARAVAAMRTSRAERNSASDG